MLFRKLYQCTSFGVVLRCTFFVPFANIFSSQMKDSRKRAREKVTLGSVGLQGSARKRMEFPFPKKSVQEEKWTYCLIANKLIMPSGNCQEIIFVFPFIEERTGPTIHVRLSSVPPSITLSVTSDIISYHTSVIGSFLQFCSRARTLKTSGNPWAWFSLISRTRKVNSTVCSRGIIFWIRNHSWLCFIVNNIASV